MTKPTTDPYHPVNHIRIVTASCLFDGHDVSINIMRRIMQSTGVEVIHLGHNRSAEEIVNCAIQEDAHAIAITSYQGGHVEFFKYILDLLKEKKGGHIKVFGGGGGTILDKEAKILRQYGITRIYSPDEGRKLGLQGMINDLVSQCDYDIAIEQPITFDEISFEEMYRMGRLITLAENHPQVYKNTIAGMKGHSVDQPVVLGITGTGGAGKSTVVDELVRRFQADFKSKKIAIVSIDPTRKRTGGALLGDRIRMNAVSGPQVFMRSMATRQSNVALSGQIAEVIEIYKHAGADLIIVETSGIGQSGVEILDHADVSIYIMTPEYGAATQLEKIDMLDYADCIVLNKMDKRGGLDALRDIRKQYQRNRELWNTELEKLPVFGTVASQFNNPGLDEFFIHLLGLINEKTAHAFRPGSKKYSDLALIPPIIPTSRIRYLSEISDEIKRYNQTADDQSVLADQLYSLKITMDLFNKSAEQYDDFSSILAKKYKSLEKSIKKDNLKILKQWPEQVKRYKTDEFQYQVRNTIIKTKTHFESLSHSSIPKVSLPKYRNWGDILKWNLQENVPGEFPYTAGVFPFKRTFEDPTRMFAGEGSPERTNRRFHYLSKDQSSIRLSTAFDSVTLYGEDPDARPDIYGKIGNSGVSVCCLDDAKKLYSGIDLLAPNSSVSMTINGPAASMTAFFLNAAIDQQCEMYIKKNGLVNKVDEILKARYDDRGIARPKYYGQKPKEHNDLGLLLLGLSGEDVLSKEVYHNIKKEVLSKVRGTVQADILKEDQAQNTCIFSTEFSLRLMGDLQEYFSANHVRSFYSVSISGYHIAEAGANPITQLAFTLANGFTLIEYYLQRGMKIDDFAPNLSFFFSNGVEPEYAVIGRVARRIWAKAIKFKYHGNERSQKLKYHIQTSGRSLHAQEIGFNDIRTTLQALYAIYDNCNSLHTNAYDEAITTPTEDSVRRALAVQQIINKELGLAKNQNPLQGSFIIEELTDLVEQAVLNEFDRITERGGVLGAMERMYQRNKIQEESMYYETLKHQGDYPIIGVNTFLSKEGSPTEIPGEVIRAGEDEKKQQIKTLNNLQKAYKTQSQKALMALKKRAEKGDNTFDQIMEASKICSLGQITHALFNVGGQYRRNM